MPSESNSVSFDPAVSYTAPFALYVATADFDGDGIMDVVAAGARSISVFPSFWVMVMALLVLLQLLGSAIELFRLQWGTLIMMGVLTWSQRMILMLFRYC